MKFTIKLSIYTLLLFLSHISISSTETADKLNLSGFGQVVLGVLDETEADFQGYSSSLSLKPETLVGIQAEYDFSSTLSLSTQLVGHTNDNEHSGISWLYLNYRPIDNIQIKIGKHKTPFFNYSDVTEVGFSYPWITPPLQIYSSYMFDYFEGIFVRYDVPNDSIGLNFEAYWGSFEDDYYIGSDKIRSNVNDLRGVISNLSINNFSFRASYHTGNSKTQIEALNLSGFAEQLRLFGFTKTADSLSIDGEMEFYQASISYEKIDYFVRGEWSKVSPQLFLVPRIESSYLTVGYNKYPFTYHMTFAQSDIRFNQPLQEIPVGVSPDLDMLYGAYLSIYENLPKDSLESISIGARWDWRTNIAFKADVTLLEGKKDNRSFFTLKEPDNFDRSAVLFQLAVTWVF